MDDHVAQAFEERGGQFTSRVFERDLTGDGQADLIPDHGGIECNGALMRSQYCGMSEG